MIVNSVNFQNSYVKNREHTPALSARAAISQNNCDSISFTGNKTGLFSKIVSTIISPFTKEPIKKAPAKKLSRTELYEICSQKLAELTKANQNGVMVISRKGKVIHTQPQEYLQDIISTDTLKKAKGQILVARLNGDQPNLSDILSFLPFAPKKMFVAYDKPTNKGKKTMQQIITFPPVTEQRTKIATDIQKDIKYKRWAADISGAVKISFVKGKSINTQVVATPLRKIEAPLVSDSLKKLGITIEEKPLQIMPKDKIIHIITAQRPKISEEVQRIFENKLAELSNKKKIEFLIFSPKGKIVHKQSNFNLKGNTIKKTEGNILVIRQISPLKLTDILDFFIVGAKKIHFNSSFSVPAKPNMTQKIITFPELTSEKSKRAEEMINRICKESRAKQLLALGLQAFDANSHRTVVLTNKNEVAKHAQPQNGEEYFNEFMQELGIKVEEKPLPANK